MRESSASICEGIVAKLLKKKIEHRKLKRKNILKRLLPALHQPALRNVMESKVSDTLKEA